MDSAACVETTKGDLVAYEAIDDTGRWQWALGTVLALPQPRLVQLQPWAFTLERAKGDGDGSPLDPGSPLATAAELAKAQAEADALQRRLVAHRTDILLRRHPLQAALASAKDELATLAVTLATDDDSGEGVSQLAELFPSAEASSPSSSSSFPVVALVLEAVLTLMREKLGTWDAMLRTIRQHDFASRVASFDPRNIGEATRTQVTTKYVRDPRFTYDGAMKASNALGPLHKWVLAQLRCAETEAEIAALDLELGGSDATRATAAELVVLHKRIAELGDAVDRSAAAESSSSSSGGVGFTWRVTPHVVSCLRASVVLNLGEIDPHSFELRLARAQAASIRVALVTRDAGRAKGLADAAARDLRLGDVEAVRRQHAATTVRLRELQAANFALSRELQQRDDELDAMTMTRRSAGSTDDSVRAESPPAPLPRSGTQRPLATETPHDDHHGGGGGHDDDDGGAPASLEQTQHKLRFARRQIAHLQSQLARAAQQSSGGGGGGGGAAHGGAVDPMERTVTADVLAKSLLRGTSDEEAIAAVADLERQLKAARADIAELERVLFDERLSIEQQLEVLRSGMAALESQLAQAMRDKGHAEAVSEWTQQELAEAQRLIAKLRERIGELERQRGSATRRATLQGGSNTDDNYNNHSNSNSNNNNDDQKPFRPSFCSETERNVGSGAPRAADDDGDSDARSARAVSARSFAATAAAVAVETAERCVQAGDTVATFVKTFEGSDWAALLAAPNKRRELEDAFRQDAAQVCGVSAERIAVSSLSFGSLRVTFDVRRSPPPTAGENSSAAAAAAERLTWTQQQQRINGAPFRAVNALYASRHRLNASDAAIGALSADLDKSRKREAVLRARGDRLAAALAQCRGASNAGSEAGGEGGLLEIVAAAADGPQPRQPLLYGSMSASRLRPADGAGKDGAFSDAVIDKRALLEHISTTLLLFAALAAALIGALTPGSVGVGAGEFNATAAGVSPTLEVKFARQGARFAPWMCAALACAQAGGGTAVALLSPLLGRVVSRLQWGVQLSLIGGAVTLTVGAALAVTAVSNALFGLLLTGAVLSGAGFVGILLAVSALLSASLGRLNAVAVTAVAAFEAACVVSAANFMTAPAIAANYGVETVVLVALWAALLAVCCCSATAFIATPQNVATADVHAALATASFRRAVTCARRLPQALTAGVAAWGLSLAVVVAIAVVGERALDRGSGSHDVPTAIAAMLGVAALAAPLFFAAQAPAYRLVVTALAVVVAVVALVANAATHVPPLLPGLACGLVTGALTTEMLLLGAREPVDTAVGAMMLAVAAAIAGPGAAQALVALLLGLVPDDEAAVKAVAALLAALQCASAAAWCLSLHRRFARRSGSGIYDGNNKNDDDDDTRGLLGIAPGPRGAQQDGGEESMSTRRNGSVNHSEGAESAAQSAEVSPTNAQQRRKAAATSDDTAVVVAVSRK